jgi:osmoprotectant transport system ATP-binding protein
MIELRGVSKSYDGKTALQPTHYAFPKGKTTALIGPSGCGKSTLLRLVMGLIRPTSGHVCFDGSPVNDWIGTRRKMGYVVQDGGLFPHFTARENVAVMAKHLNWPPDKIAKRITELADLTHFPQDGLERFPAELSGGQKQRVSLMRALMLEPQVLLLDEPLGALDPMVRAKLQTDLKEVFQRLEQTVIFVTHDMGEAGYLGDELVLLNEGKIVQRGQLTDLRDRPADDFVVAFLNAQRSLVSL